MKTLKVFSAIPRSGPQDNPAERGEGWRKKPLGSIAKRLEARSLSASERVARLALSLPVLHGFAGLAKEFREGVGGAGNR